MIGLCHYLVRPLDTLFFRDGQPFEQEDEGMADIRSLFPPWPPMLAGAFRAAVARRMGWNGIGDWPEQIRARLGDGPEDTGTLAFGPPVVLYEHSDRPEMLYPAPRHLMRAPQADRPAALLRPAEGEWTTDIGPMRLVGGGVAGAKECSGCWLDARDMTRVLMGQLPARLIPADALRALEYRVGL